MSRYLYISGSRRCGTLFHEYEVLRFLTSTLHRYPPFSPSTRLKREFLRDLKPPHLALQSTPYQPQMIRFVPSTLELRSSGAFFLLHYCFAPSASGLPPTLVPQDPRYRPPVADAIGLIFCDQEERWSERWFAEQKFEHHQVRVARLKLAALIVYVQQMPPISAAIFWPGSGLPLRYERFPSLCTAV